jgi:hypothetical protein
VEYRIDGFLDTSRDKLGDDLMSLIDTCCDGYFTAALATPAGASNKSSSRTSAVKSQTLGKKFKIQLESLLAMLTTTQPHYIKCIKPNTMKVPNCFQGPTCFSQLQALGIFEAVSIRKRGYPCRVTHEEFCHTYGPLFKSQLMMTRHSSHGSTTSSSSLRIRSEVISSELNKRNGNDPIAHFLVGKTKIFSKFEARDMSKKLLDRYHHRCVLKIQSIARGFLTRLLFCDFCYAALDTNSFLSKYAIAHEGRAIAEAGGGEEATAGEGGGDEVKKNEMSFLEEVEVLLKRLERFPYQHHQRLLEVKERILEEIKLFDEIEKMQLVSYEEIDSQWMSRAQYARRKKIRTTAAVKVYEMFEIVMRGGDDETTTAGETRETEAEREQEERSTSGGVGVPQGEGIDHDQHLLTEKGKAQQQEEEEVAEYRERQDIPLVSRLMCGLCLKSFESPPLKRAPRYLSCLHTFCSSCLSDRIDRSTGTATAGPGGTAIMCPHPDCRVLSRCPEGVSSFKIAYALVQELSPICRNCEQRNAVCQCHQCPQESSLLCMVCLKAHNKIKAYKKHSVSGLDSTIDTTQHHQQEKRTGTGTGTGQESVVELSSLSKCSIHSEKSMEAYCQTCQELTCLTCAVFHHSNHLIQPYHHAAELERNRLLPCLSDLLNDVSSLQSKQIELTQTVTPTLDEQRNLLKDLSNRIFSNLFLSLSHRRTDFLSALDLHYSQKRKALVEFTDLLTSHIMAQESSRRICEEMLDIGNDTEVLSLAQTFQSHLDDMIMNSWQLDLSNLETTLCFSCGPEHEVRSLISSIGICKGSLICAEPTQSTVEILQIGEFCQRWQVFFRLTLRNSKGQRMLKGGHAVTIEVEEHHEIFHSSTSPLTAATTATVAVTGTGTATVGGTHSHNSTGTTSPVTSVPVGLGKSHTATKKHFSLKSAQVSSPPSQPHPLSSSANASMPPRNNRQSKSNPNQFTTGLTDNQDGTYHLLVTHSPPALKPSETSGENGGDVPSTELLPEAVKVSVKIFGVHVEGSPFVFHPGDPQEMMNFNTHFSSSTAQRDETAPSGASGSGSNGNREFTSVTSFLKYISGGLIQT